MARKPKSELKHVVEANGVEISHDNNVGLILKNARLAKKLSLEDVSKTLCITKSFLMRLEDHSDSLPVDVYTLGFLRSYAKFLSLDVDQLSSQFKSSNSAPEKEENLTFPKPLPKRGIPHIRIVSISLAFAFLLVAGWETITTMTPQPSGTLGVEKLSQDQPSLTALHSQAQSRNELDQEDDIIKVAALEHEGPAPVFTGESIAKDEELISQNHSELNTQLIIPAESSSQLPDAPHVQAQHVEATLETSQTPHPAQDSVTMSFTEETWLQVKDSDGQVLVNRTFKPGASYELKSPKTHTVKVGNAGGVNLLVAGKDLGKLGATGQVMGNIKLDPEKLLAQPVETH